MIFNENVTLTFPLCDIRCCASLKSNWKKYIHGNAYKVKMQKLYAVTGDANQQLYVLDGIQFTTHKYALYGHIGYW